jgi:alkylation response protein AidB-like acyl-CoA dehydrogenase
VRDGDVYVVNGQKIWTSLADHALYGILIARTRTDTTKHRGISYFIIPMNLPGIEVHPIASMTGPDAFGFNQVFFTDVRVPVENLIGEENLGWGMAKTTLANERVSLSTGGGLQWGYGPSARELVAHYRGIGGVADTVRRQQVVDAYIEGEILRYHRMRMISAAVNKKPGPDASLRKALADPHGKRVFTLAKDLMGAHGMLTTSGVLGPEWDHGFLFSPALTIGGGTSEVLRNIIAERLLGLPHDPEASMNASSSRGTSGPIGA